MVKNHIYFPSVIYEYQINADFEKNKIGEHEYHSRNWKGVEFDVFISKDPNYNMIMMYK